MRKPNAASMNTPQGGTPGRLPLHQMTPQEVLQWIQQTRVALQQKMRREQAYLERRAARGTHTPTDDAFEADLRLEADLLALLTEIEEGVAEVQP